MTRPYRGRTFAALVRLLALSGATAITLDATVARADDLIDYTVKKGDTCAAIAQRQWGDSRRVDLIHQFNPNMGPPPHDLKEGTVLHIPKTIPQTPVAAGPDAKLTHFRNKVQTLTPDPSPAKQDAALVRGNRVSTEDQSAAQVTFRDESQIELGEKTLVVILGDMRASAAKQAPGDTTLVTGSLRSRLGQLAGGKPPVIATEGARVTLGRGATQISVDEQKTTRLAVYDGQSTLSSQKKDVVVPTNYGSKALFGKPPTPPKPLPGAPTWKTALPGLTFTSSPVAEVKGAYQPGTTGDAVAQYHVQIARDATFLEIVTDVDVPATITELDAKNLTPGDYFVRVSAIDADRFEGPFAAPSSVRVVSLAPAPGAPWAQDLTLGTLGGLSCAVDGAPSAEIKGDVRLDRFHAHDLKCTKPDGSGGAEAHLAAEPFELRWSFVAGTTPRTATLRAEAKDSAGHPVDHVTLAVGNVAGVDVEPFTSEAPGVYAAKITWAPGTAQLAAKVAANGEAHGEISYALEAPALGNTVEPALTDTPPKATFGEAGIEAGFSGAATGIGPLVGFRGGVRQDFGRFELSVNALFAMEARSTDETGALPTTLTGGTIVSSYATSERIYTVGVPVEGRYKLGRSPFSVGLGLTPFLALENANVSYFGGNVALKSPNTVFGLSALGVVHLVAGPGSIVLTGGIRFSTTKDRDVFATDMLGPYVSLGYRLAL